MEVGIHKIPTSFKLNPMRKLIDYSFRVNADTDASEVMNLEQKAMDNEFLLSLVAEGKISQATYDKLQTTKDVLEHVYPNLWDLQLQIKTATVVITYEIQQGETLPLGCYFGYEGWDEYGDVDTHHHWEDNIQRARPTVEHVTKSISYFDFNFLVKYPEVTITNSKGRSHNIKDLYFLFSFDTGCKAHKYGWYDGENNLTLRVNPVGETDTLITTDEPDASFIISEHCISDSLSGARETLSPIEYNKGYAHSHLTSRSRPSGFTVFGKCCLGHGEIRNTLAFLQAEFTSELLTLFLFQLDAYSKWESLEGGPHINMSNLIEGQPITEFPMMYELYYHHLAYIKNRLGLNPADIDWKLENQNGTKKMVIIDNEKFEKFCRRSDNINDYNNYEVFLRDSNGNYYAKDSVPSTTRIRASTLAPYYIVFRGEKRMLKVETIETGAVMEEDFYLNPHIKKIIKHKLETHANYKKIKRDVAGRAHQIGNYRGNSQQDQIALPENTQS